MLELNRAEFAEREDWYYRYSDVLLSEVAQLPRDIPVTGDKLRLLYASILGIVRFLEVRILVMHTFGRESVGAIRCI